MKWISSILLAGVLVLNCQNSTDVTGDSARDNSPVKEDLPQPALDTAEISLNGQRHTLTNKLSCANGVAGIGLTSAGGANPTLFLEDVNFATQGNVTLTSPGPWRLHFDPIGGGFPWEPQAGGCAATIVENSTTVFEMKASDCKIRIPPGGATNPASGVGSLRVRCTKQP